MSGLILQLARQMSKRIVTSLGFEEDIKLSNIDESLTIEIKGFATKHHINYDGDGNPINSQNAHLCITEDDLIKLSFPYRNQNGKIGLKQCKVLVKDSSGIEKKYIVIENFPNETLGLIVLILGEYATN